MLYPILRLLSVLLCKLFFRLRVTGKEFIPKEGGVLLVSNHASYLDPVVLGVAYPRSLWFFARSDLFKNPFFGWLIRQLHAFPVQLHRPLDKDAIERAIKELREGKTVVVFPEGTRSRDGELHAGQAGVGLLAVKAGVPVLPVYLRGAYQAFPPGAQVFRPKKISVHFGTVLSFRPSSPQTEEKDAVPLRVGRRQIFYQKIADQMMEAIREIKNLTES